MKNGLFQFCPFSQFHPRFTVDEIRIYVGGLFGERWDGEAFVLIDLSQRGVKPLEVIKTASNLIDFVLVVQIEKKLQSIDTWR